MRLRSEIADSLELAKVEDSVVREFNCFQAEKGDGCDILTEALLSALSLNFDR